MDDKITAYFKNGVLYKIRPFRFRKVHDDIERAYEARYIVSDGIKYDLMDIESVKTIDIPQYAQDAPIGVTGYLEYVLKMHIPSGNDELDVEILITYTQLLKYSYWEYDAKEYYRLPKKLYEMGDFENGDRFLQQLKTFVPQIFNSDQTGVGNLRELVERWRPIFKGDLLELAHSWTKCEKCAKYQGRVYSINGDDSRFPRLPDDIIKTGKVCDNGCETLFRPFMHGANTKIQYYTNSGCIIERDAIACSNRPYYDDRTENDKIRYYKVKAERDSRIIKEKYYMKNYRNYCYKKIHEPFSVPKSFSAYMRKLNKEGKLFE